jgi:hypothetical protein
MEILCFVGRAWLFVATLYAGPKLAEHFHKGSPHLERWRGLYCIVALALWFAALWHAPSLGFSPRGSDMDGN